MNNTLKLSVFLALAGMFFTSCADRVSLGPAHLISRSNQPATIELRTYSFNPNHVVILHTVSPRILRLTNTADTWHNFTLVDPEDKVILSRNLDPRESIMIRLDSLPSANYLFYCNRFLHRYRGMEGMLMID